MHYWPGISDGDIAVLSQAINIMFISSYFYKFLTGIFKYFGSEIDIKLSLIPDIPFCKRS